MTPKERETMRTLLAMVENMVVPQHDEFQGHSKRTCGICLAVKNSKEILVKK